MSANVHFKTLYTGCAMSMLPTPPTKSPQEGEKMETNQAVSVKGENEAKSWLRKVAPWSVLINFQIPDKLKNKPTQSRYGLA